MAGRQPELSRGNLRVDPPHYGDLISRHPNLPQIIQWHPFWLDTLIVARYIQS